MHLKWRINRQRSVECVHRSRQVLYGWDNSTLRDRLVGAGALSVHGRSLSASRLTSRRAPDYSPRHGQLCCQGQTRRSMATLHASSPRTCTVPSTCMVGVVRAEVDAQAYIQCLIQWCTLSAHVAASARPGELAKVSNMC